MNAIIICAGPPKIFGAHVRQCVPVFGEPLICRTVRQCRAFGVNPIVITQPNETDLRIRAVLGKQAEVFPVANTSCLCETLLLSCEKTTPARHLFLLGDVIYSEAAWVKMMRGCDAIRCFGSFAQGEIFSASFPFRAFVEVQDKLRQAVHSKASGKTDGEMWQFYRSVIQVPLERHLIEDTTFVDIEDGFTCDLDAISKYEAFLYKWAVTD